MPDDLEHVEEEKPSLIKKISVSVISLFLMFLIVSFTFTGAVGDIVASLIESETIEDGLVELEDFSVQFVGNSYDILLDVYNNNLEYETKVCLKGYVEENKYYVDEVYLPVIYSQTFNQVVSEACPTDTLIALHSHPYRHCIASEQDLSNLETAKLVNPDAIIGIMCEEERFSFYS
tara:strand:+ start:7055 stop:7582 length:528 start_codon:yes stop_codon:yes gene_type:complete